MEVQFADPDLDRLETDLDFTAGQSRDIVKAFRKRMQQIRSAVDEREFYNLGAVRFEKLKGQRAHQHSMRLNDQFRLILEFAGQSPGKIVVVVAIADYH